MRPLSTDGAILILVFNTLVSPSVVLSKILQRLVKPGYQWHIQAEYSRSWKHPHGSRLILLSPLQMETVSKILNKMRPLSIDGAILILVLHCPDIEDEPYNTFES